jgi:acetylornithine deacetylase/succinyl-diaminopimelate desuccinylase-like protein
MKRTALIIIAVIYLQACAFAQSLFYPDLAKHPHVAQALQYVDQNREALISEWIKITEIPAPSRKEADRAAYMKSEFVKAGLEDVQQDAAGNVIGVRPGRRHKPRVVFAAHMDTVFPEGTEIKVKREAGRLSAPGISDDSASCALLLTALRALKEAKVETEGDLIFVATVQEEIGLQGMRAFLKDWKDRVDMVVAIDGSYGSVSYGALGLRWWKFIYSGSGAHTMASRGKPNPARAVAKAIENIYRLSVPDAADRWTIYNVGMVNGGKVFNAMPQEAFFTVDMRSVSKAELDKLDRRVSAIAEAAAREIGIEFRKENHQLSSPAQTPGAADAPIVRTAEAVLKFLGVAQPTLSPRGATDANVGMEYGIPSVAIGRTYSTGVHTLEESAEIDPIFNATKQVILLALSLSKLTS